MRGRVVYTFLNRRRLQTGKGCEIRLGVNTVVKLPFSPPLVPLCGMKADKGDLMVNNLSHFREDPLRRVIVKPARQ